MGKHRYIEGCARALRYGLLILSWSLPWKLYIVRVKALLENIEETHVMYRMGLLELCLHNMFIL